MERFKPLKDAFTELKRPAGKFRIPLTLSEHIILRASAVLFKILEKIVGTVFIQEKGDPISAQWKALLGYLFKEGLLKKPEARFASFTDREPYIPRVHLIPGSVTGLTDGSDSVEQFSGGSSPDTEEALSKAVGELLERYPFLIYRSKDLIHKSIAVLKKEEVLFVDPHIVSQFDEEQKRKFPNRNFSDTDTFRWVRGFSATAKRDILIPAQLIYWNYRFQNEPVLRQPTTNGMGGFFTLEEAILSGLYELLHRDGILLHWLTNTAPPRIQLETIPDKGIQDMIRECRSKNLELYIFDVTTDIPAPAVACALIDRNGPALSMGGGGDHNPLSAIRQAISETTAVYHWLTNQTATYTLPQTYKPLFTPISQKERALLWKNNEMLPLFEFFLKGQIHSLTDSFRFLAEIPNEPKKRLDHYADLLSRKGPEYELIWHEAKHPALTALGYHAAHAVVPALLPLYLTETYAPLDAPRLHAFRVAHATSRGASINAVPQPFT